MWRPGQDWQWEQAEVLGLGSRNMQCRHGLSFGESAMNPHAHGMGLHSIGKEPPKMCLSVSVTIYLNLQDSITRADHRRGRGIRAAAAVARIILRRRVWTGTNGRRRRVRS